MAEQQRDQANRLDDDIIAITDVPPQQPLQNQSRTQFSPEEIVAELGDTALPDIEAITAKLVRLGVRMIPAADELSITTVTGRNARTLATSGTVAFNMDMVQYRSREKGPCVRSARTTEVICVNDLAVESRWPEFRDAALAKGIRASLSMPLQPVELRLVLNCYSRTQFDPTDVEMAELVATWGEVAIANLALRQQAERLRQRTLSESESRKVIEQAKGVLMHKHNLDEQGAFEHLRQLSQAANRKLREIATEIVGGNGKR